MDPTANRNNPLYRRTPLYYEETGSITARFMTLFIAILLSPLTLIIHEVIAEFAVKWIWSFALILIIIFVLIQAVEALSHIYSYARQRSTTPDPPPEDE